jgi:hypothetical protein
MVSDGKRFVREVVVRRYTDPKRPYAYLSWKEGRDLPELLSQNPDGSKPPATNGNTSAMTLGKMISPGATP